jgi:hypothetical protein
MVIVAAAEADLLVAAVAYPRTDRHRRTKVERGTSDGPELAGRDRSRVGRQEMLGRNGEQVTHPAFRLSLPRQVPVGVVRQVDQGRPIGGRAVLYSEPARFIEAVCGRHLQRARIILVAVRADISQRDAGERMLGRVDDVPMDLVEAGAAAVKRVRAIIDRQLVGLPVQLEASVGDTVGDPANGRTEIFGAGEIAFQRRIAERHVRHPAIAVGHDHRLDRGAERQDAYRHAGRVGQGDRFGFRAIGQAAERFTDEGWW